MNGKNEKLKESEKNTDENNGASIDTSDNSFPLNAKKGLHCLNIIGQIEGHYVLDTNQKTTKYEHVIPLLVGIEEADNIEGLLITLNTVGGDVESGLAIAEAIASMKKPTVSLILGGAHSIGLPLAVAAKRSFIVPSATLTIHPVRISGTVIGSPQTYNYFKEMQSRIVSFVTKHSNVSAQKFTELMMRPDEMANDVGSIVDGKEAVDLGIIDSLGGLDAALGALREMTGESDL